MPRDYKHRAQKKPKKKPVSGWLWLLTGLLLGGFVASLAWIKGQSADDGGEWVGARPDRPPQGASERRARRDDVPPAPKPRFDFYDMLPNMPEVGVPDEPIEDLRPPAGQDHAGDAGRYLLQVGSFRRHADAERVKAQLALLGIEAQVVSAKIGPQDTRYRVRSGPYEGRAAMRRASRRLVDNGFEVAEIPLGGG